MTGKLAGLKSYKYGPVRGLTAAPANSSGTGPAILTALRLPSMPWPRRKARRAMPTCRTTITMFRSSCSSKTWIGELLIGREEFTLAYVFLRAAGRRWQQVAPPKAASVAALMRQIEARIGGPLQIKDEEVERICLDWILGRNVDIVASDFRL